MLSIDVSNTYIYLVEGEFSRGRIKIQRYCMFPTPEGSVKNGVIVGTTELAQAIGENLSKNRFKSKNAIVTINSTAVVTREVTVPAVNPREMQNLLLGEINQTSSSKQDSVIDYVILERLNEQDAAVCRVLCVVVPRTMIVSCREMVEKHLGLNARSMNVGMHALYKLEYLDRRMEAGNAVIIAGINEDELRINLLEGKTKIFNRTIPISEAKDVVDSEYILSNFHNNLVSDQAKQERLIATASENISKMMQFQSMKNKTNPVERVYLCADLSDEPEIAAGISEMTGVPVEPLTPPDYIDCDAEFPFCRYARAVGALIAL